MKQEKTKMKEGIRKELDNIATEKGIPSYGMGSDPWIHAYWTEEKTAEEYGLERHQAWDEWD